MVTMLASSSARLLWRYGLAQNIDVDVLFRASDLDPAELERGGARYPRQSVLAVWKALADQATGPAIGIEIARHFRILDIQTLGVAFLSSSTLLTALRRLDRFEHILSSDLDNTLVEDEHRVDLLLGEVGVTADNTLRRVMEDTRLAAVLTACRYGIGGELDPIEVALPYSAPDDTAPYYGFFRCPLVYGADRARLSFSIQDALRSFTTANRDLAHSSDHVLQRALIKLGTNDVIGQARRAIMDALPSGAPREEEIARILCMSARTLQRKLAEQETSFSSLLTEVRRELAEQYVADPSVPVIEISYLLGFSEVSAFSRAFKRWTGVPPGEYRERVG